MLTGRRYLLAFTSEQVAYAERIGDVWRAVWNTGLEQRREYCRRGGFISYVKQARQLAEAKREPGLEWLADVPSHTLQQTLRDLEKACRRHGTLTVRWRSKGRTPPSFRFSDPGRIEVRRLSRRWGQVKLSKFGWVRFRWNRSLNGTIRNATVLRDGDRWYVSSALKTASLRSSRTAGHRSAWTGALRSRWRPRTASCVIATSSRRARPSG